MTVTCHVQFGNGRGRGDPPPDRNPLSHSIQAIAAHESPQPTKLYDRTSDAIELDEIERIRV